MHFSTTTATILATAATVLAQTPPEFQPQTNSRLDVTYGNTPVTPGIELPQALVQTAPRVNTQESGAGPYMLALLDLSLPASMLPPNSVLVPGIGGSGRTTRLHWLQTNLTAGADGLLTPLGTPAVAPYAGPQPPQGDIGHTYSFFLFNQPATFQVPAALLTGAFTPQGASVRNNFSLTPITSQEGVQLLEGNYMVVQNANNSGAVTTAPGYTPNGTTTGGSASGTASPTGTSAPITSFTGAAAKIGAAVPALGLGALAMMFL